LNKNYFSFILFLFFSLPNCAYSSASSMTTNLYSVISMELFANVPFPTKIERMHEVKCRNGIAYISKKDNAQSEQWMATAVCRKNGNTNSASWVIHVPEATEPTAARGKYEWFHTKMDDPINSGLIRPGTIGLDCNFLNAGWSCKETFEAQAYIAIIVKNNFRKNNSVIKYMKFLGSVEQTQLKPQIGSD
jgi:hypothetical protein